LEDEAVGSLPFAGSDGDPFRSAALLSLFDIIQTDSNVYGDGYDGKTQICTTYTNSLSILFDYRTCKLQYFIDINLS